MDPTAVEPDGHNRYESSENRALDDKLVDLSEASFSPSIKLIDPVLGDSLELGQEKARSLVPLLCGKWIALEGVDASGKSTQLKIVSKLFESIGCQVIEIPELSNSTLGTCILSVIKEHTFFSLHNKGITPLADSLTMLADIVYSLELQQDSRDTNQALILSDRGPLSVLVQQLSPLLQAPAHGSSSNGGVDNKLAKVLFLLLDQVKTPDLNIVLDVEDQHIDERLAARGERGRTEEEVQSLRNYRKLFCSLGDVTPISVVDTSGTSTKAVTFSILETLHAFFKNGLNKNE